MVLLIKWPTFSLVYSPFGLGYVFFRWVMLPVVSYCVVLCCIVLYCVVLWYGMVFSGMV